MIGTVALKCQFFSIWRPLQSCTGAERVEPKLARFNAACRGNPNMPVFSYPGYAAVGNYRVIAFAQQFGYATSKGNAPHLYFRRYRVVCRVNYAAAVVITAMLAAPYINNIFTIF
jgi:hypothetical protein